MKKMSLGKTQVDLRKDGKMSLGKSIATADHVTHVTELNDARRSQQVGDASTRDVQ